MGTQQPHDKAEDKECDAHARSALTITPAGAVIPPGKKAAREQQGKNDDRLQNAVGAADAQDFDLVIGKLIFLPGTDDGEINRAAVECAGLDAYLVARRIGESALPGGLRL